MTTEASATRMANAKTDETYRAATCAVCGDPGKPFVQEIYGRTERVVLCPDHVKSRKSLGYTLRSAR